MYIQLLDYIYILVRGAGIICWELNFKINIIYYMNSSLMD